MNIEYKANSDERGTALVVLSGGQDSTTCLAWARTRYHTVHAITFVYGQRHAVEVDSAIAIAKVCKVASHRIVDLSEVLVAPSRMLAGDGELDLSGESRPGIASTFVPVRNQMMLTVAANYAYVVGAANLVTGVCQTDFSGYPDCRRDFIDALQLALNSGTFTGEDHLRGRITIHTPLMWLTKAESVDLAREVGAYSLLALSHTAYTGGGPLDTDAASILRARGFEEAGVPDPLVLRYFIEGKYKVEDLPQWYRDIPHNEWGAYLAMAARHLPLGSIPE